MYVVSITVLIKTKLWRTPQVNKQSQPRNAIERRNMVILILLRYTKLAACTRSSRDNLLAMPELAFNVLLMVRSDTMVLCIDLIMLRQCCSENLA